MAKVTLPPSEVRGRWHPRGRRPEGAARRTPPAEGRRLMDKSDFAQLRSSAVWTSYRWRGGACGESDVTFTVEVEQETDGRWMGEGPELPGALVYGATPQEAVAKVKTLALGVLADRLEHGEADASLDDVIFATG